MTVDTKRAIAEINDAIAFYAAARQRSRHPDLGDLPAEEQEELASRLGSVLSRFAPPGSVYERKLRSHLEKNWEQPHVLNQSFPGMLAALRDDYGKGNLRSIMELVRGDLLSDLLDVASDLLGQSIDAAAMLGGGVLEEHLRRMCGKFEVEIAAKDGKKKLTEAMATDLARAEVGAISKTDHKSITYWYGIRSDPAHGHFGKHNSSEVGLMIQGIREFVARNPA